MNSRLPLENIRVLDFSHVWAGPMLAGLLADMGAQVIKIETRGRPDLWRTRPGIKYKDLDADKYELCPGFHNLNRNKMSITLNLKNPKAIEIIKKLASCSDIVNENMTAGTMASLGLGYNDLKSVKEDIIYISSCAFGQTGDLAGLPGYGPTMQALSGFDYTLGYYGERPLGLFAIPFSDGNAATQGAIIVLAALYRRNKTGKGMYIDYSQVEGLMSLIGSNIMQAVQGKEVLPKGNCHPAMSPYNFYPCKGEDEWVSIAVKTEEEWKKFCQAAGHPEWVSDERFADASRRVANRKILDELISEWTRQYSAEEITRILRNNQLAAAPLLNPEQFENHPLFKDRSFVQTTHTIVGKQSLFGLPWRFSEMPKPITKPAPVLGEHNDYVLSEILGISQEEINRLKEEKVIY